MPSFHPSQTFVVPSQLVSWNAGLSDTRQPLLSKVPYRSRDRKGKKQRPTAPVLVFSLQFRRRRPDRLGWVGERSKSKSKSGEDDDGKGDGKGT